MTTQQTSAPASRRPRLKGRPIWLVPTGLILLSLVPVIAGAFRLTELTVGAEVTDTNARFFNSPVPVVAHVVAATIYLLLGAFQFVPQLRRGRPSWHRVSGRILAPAGVITGLSGMWMAVFYPRPEYDTIVRVGFAALMVMSILLGLRAVLRRDIRSHRAWMIRGYAVGIGAGTQVLVFLAWVPISGGAPVDGPTEVALLTAGWIINLAIAEIVIRRSVT
ncbi:DUF2306 domain-containing protein [Salinibacterium sp. G-O1]|uniref:DUF2306 domain-containing protein n=1 Tax=Salinibacterium sp. G-O1 TaxID=3046208 RepID=UPI0024B98F5E|nr:DUF2306 domain-containing protein [Salinibacterium sp. G-O1]MDJ0334044.1 DUF2306 domain-containing protein [Salinibacterium sp. G-O1]